MTVVDFLISLLPIFVFSAVVVSGATLLAFRSEVSDALAQRRRVSDRAVASPSKINDLHRISAGEEKYDGIVELNSGEEHLLRSAPSFVAHDVPAPIDAPVNVLSLLKRVGSETYATTSTAFQNQLPTFERRCAEVSA